ncbi:B12-binding domain-containing protein, partial [Thermobrachium celere]|uniref:B12-binding domain-containing protein n=1 Tax=Thermobrachium celere TaxID=53422 RepID=UPI00194257D4
NILTFTFETLYTNYTDIMMRLDENGIEKCKQDVKYHTSFLLQALTLNSPSLFIDYVKWVKELFLNIGISIDGFVKSLYAIEQAIGLLFGEQNKALANEFINIAVQEITNSTINTEYKQDDNVFKEYKNMYLNYLLDAKRMEAMDLINRLVKQGYSVKDIYLYIFKESLYEVGLLWQTGRVTVAQEHYFTAST